MDEKRDKKALGAALLTLPISIIGAADPALATTGQGPVNNDPAQEKVGPVSKSATQSSATNTTVSSSQLSYTVKAGDTISKIARKFSLSSSQLLQINKLTEKSFIFPGQKLKLVANAIVSETQTKADATTVHTVRVGDTITSIAKKYLVPVSTVLAMNNLKATAIIFPGQKLTIGSVVEKPTAKILPKEHTVASGETLKSIAALYGITLDQLLKANGLTGSSLVYVGQKLNLKGEVAVAAPTTSETSTDNANNNGAVTLSSDLISTDPHRPSSVCQTHGFHTVKSGESISKIAAVYGVSTQSVLSANSLTWSATIFIGQQLVIPGVHEIQFCPDLTILTDEMKSNAQTIFRIGKELGVSDYGIVIALATAMQESGLRNLTYGDRDSVGLFQQRPSAHWGSAEQILDTEYASRAFFGGNGSPTYGVARGLLDIKNWSTLSLTQAAQAVQVSAYPNAYAKWESSAWVWLDQLLNSANQ